MKKLLFLLALALSGSSISAQPWAVDASHSNVLFTVDHLVISEVQGYFRIFDGNLTSSKPDLSDASVDFSIDVASINTDNDYRDKHLKSDDFFNAEKFPKMTFKSKSFKKVKDNMYKLNGTLTIRDVSREVTFDVKYRGEAKNGMGKMVRAFNADLAIDRFAYGLKWSKATELGGAIVGKDVRIRCNMEFVKN